MTTAAAALMCLTLLAGCGGGHDKSANPGSPGARSVEQQLGFSTATSPAAQAEVENDIAA